MTDLPEPMTPADCDLRGLPFMPLDVIRLADSDLFALSTGDEFKSAVALWCKAWLQVPAASLPDDDRILAHLSTAGSRWAKVKAMALRGWVKCSDGRLYHPTVADKARQAWKARQAQRARAEKRWHGKKNDGGNADDMPQGGEDSSHDHDTGIAETHAEQMPEQCHGISRGNARERERERDISSLRSDTPRKPPAAETPGPARDFEEFWAAYPRKVGKDGARKAFDKARKRATQAEIMHGLSRHIAVWPGSGGERAQFIPHPATWLNRGDWQGDAASSAAASAGRPSHPPAPSDRLAIWDRVPDHPGV